MEKYNQDYIFFVVGFFKKKAKAYKQNKTS